MKWTQYLCMAAIAAVPALATQVYAPPQCGASPTDVLTVDCPGSLTAASGATLQQEYSATLFGVDPIDISSIAFRPDTTNLSTSATITLTFIIGTTTQDVTTLGVGCTIACTSASFVSSTTEINNTGVSFTTSNTGTPKPFDYVLTLPTAYHYDPSSGDNLLIQIAISGVTGTAPVLDSVGTSRQASTGGVISGGGFTIPLNGLITQITYDTSIPGVPEPSTLWTMGGGFLGLALGRKRLARFFGR